MEKPYRTLSDYLRETHGCKMRKICIDGGFTCPNRDGTCGVGGCVFCGERGAGEQLDPPMNNGSPIFRILPTPMHRLMCCVPATMLHSAMNVSAYWISVHAPTASTKKSYSYWRSTKSVARYGWNWGFKLPTNRLHAISTADMTTLALHRRSRCCGSIRFP